MSLTAQGRGTFVLPAGGLGILGRGALGRSGSQRVFAAFPLPSSFVNNTGPPSELTPSSVRGLALAAAVADLQSKGAIESASSEPGFYSRLFVTPKVTGGWRPVINLSCLNRFARLSPFCMETAQSVLQSLRRRDWMVSLDLQDACLQVPVHPESRRYLRFCIDPRTFQFRVLCFGLSSAPQVFTCVMALISSIMHRHGFRILRYLDDWLVLGSSREEIVRARDFLLSLCDQLGVLVNLDKSSLLPSQTIDYLGMSLHTSPLRAFSTQTRIQKVLSLVRVHLLTCTTSSTLEVPLGSHVISDSPHSRCSALDVVPPVALEDCRSLPVELGSDLLGRLLPPGSSVVVRCQSSRGNTSSAPPPVHRRVRYRLRSHSRRRPLVRLVDSGHLVIPSATASSWRFYMHLGVSFIFSAASLCPSSQTTLRLLLTSASKGAPGRRLSIRWLKPSSASAKPTMFFCSPSLYLGSSMSLRIPSAAIPRCWDPSGLCVRRFAGIFSAVGRSLSTCSPLP